MPLTQEQLKELAKAISEGNHEELRRLLSEYGSEGINDRIVDMFNTTLLEVAVTHISKLSPETTQHILTLLLEYEADPNHVNHNTPPLKALANYSGPLYDHLKERVKAAVVLLLQHNAKFNPITLATLLKTGDPTIISNLWEYRANITESEEEEEKRYDLYELSTALIPVTKAALNAGDAETAGICRKFFTFFNIELPPVFSDIGKSSLFPPRYDGVAPYTDTGPSPVSVMQHSAFHLFLSA